MKNISNINNTQQKRSGSILLPVMIAVLVLFVIAVAMMGLGRVFRLQSVQHHSAITAQLAADAGLSRSIYDMGEKLKQKPWSNAGLPSGSEYLPSDSGSFEYKVSGNFVNGYEVESTGKSRQASRTVKATLRLVGLYEYGIYVGNFIDLQRGASITGINFGPSERPLEIATSSSDFQQIVLSKKSLVDGNVMSGFGSDPDSVVQIKGDADVTGDISAMAANWEPPFVEVPDYLKALPSLGILEDGTTLANNARVDAIDLKKGQTITIDGEVELFVDGDIDLGQNSHIELVTNDPDASLAIYVEGNVIERKGASMNNFTYDSRKFSLFGGPTTKSIQLKKDGAFYGTIYAPNAEVVVHGKMDIAGAVVADSFTLKRRGDFYYDAQLRDVSTDDVGARFEIARWEEQ
jgi:hypothetical protein